MQEKFEIQEALNNAYKRGDEREFKISDAKFAIVMEDRFNWKLVTAIPHGDSIKDQDGEIYENERIVEIYTNSILTPDCVIVENPNCCRCPLDLLTVNFTPLVITHEQWLDGGVEEDTYEY